MKKALFIMAALVLVISLASSITIPVGAMPLINHTNSTNANYDYSIWPGSNGFSIAPLFWFTLSNQNLMTYLGMNVNTDINTPSGNQPNPFADPRIREAVYLAMNRDEIAKADYTNYSNVQKVQSIVTPDTPDNVNLGYDPVRAKQLLADAGYPNGFSTTIMTTPLRRIEAQLVQVYLSAIGINAPIVYDLNFPGDLNNKSLGLFLKAAAVDWSQPSELLGRLLLSDGAENYTGYSNSQFDTLFNTGSYLDAENLAFEMNVWPFSFMTYLGMNVNPTVGNQPNQFADPRVREAVDLAMNRYSIVTIDPGAEPVQSIVTPDTPDGNLGYDPVRAKQLLADAGYSGFSTTLTTTPLRANEAQLVKIYLAAIGINATIVYDPNFPSDLNNKSLGLFLKATTVNWSQPSELLGRLLLSNGAENYTGYSNPQFDTLFNNGSYLNAENLAFDPNSDGFSVAPLFWVPPTLIKNVPASTPKGGGDCTFAVNGFGFIPGCVVQWNDDTNNVSLQTTFVSTVQLSAVVPSALITQAKTAEIRVYNPITGSSSNPIPFFVTDNTSVTQSSSGTSYASDGTTSTSINLSGTTNDQVTAQASGAGTVSVAQYDSDPGGAASFNSTSAYFDVYLSQDSTFSAVTIVVAAGDNGNVVYWWNGTTWVAASNQVYNQVTNSITITVSTSTTPSLNDLKGSVFGVAMPPSITINVPANGAVYSLNQVVTASWNVTDSISFSAEGTVNDGSPIDTSTAGSHSFTVNATDISGNTATSKINYIVNKADTTTTGITTTATYNVKDQTVNLTAKVSSSGGPVNEGTVTFTVQNGATLIGSAVTSITVSNGNANASYTLPGGTPAGTYKIVSVYSGGTDFKSSNPGTGQLVVSQAPDQTFVISIPNPSVYGSQVTFIAVVLPSSINPANIITSNNGSSILNTTSLSTILGNYIPTGSITFMDGTSTLGTVKLSKLGFVTFTISSLAAGNHSITAKYLGDTNYLSSVSGTLTQKINKAKTTLSLSSSLNPSKSGNIVAFTARVTWSGAGTPTGIITFKDNVTGKTLGTGNLSADGHATFSASSLSKGTYSITAAYAGDDNFEGSSSNTFSQTIK